MATQSTYEPFKDAPVERSGTHSYKVALKILCGWTQFLIILDLLMNTGVSWKEVLSREESAVKKEGQACFLTAVDPMNVPMLTPRFEHNEPRMIPNKMKWRNVQNTVYWFDLKIAQDRGLAFHQSKGNAT